MIDSRPDAKWLQPLSLRDERLSAELHRFDPYDIIGYAALTAALANAAASAAGAFAASETLLSISLVGGLLSYVNFHGVLSKAALVLTLLHVLFLLMA